jgi:hypothetical protein
LQALHDGKLPKKPNPSDMVYRCWPWTM